MSEFADLSLFQLLEVNRLRSRFREARAKYTQQIQQSRFMPVTGEAIKKVCQDNQWSFKEQVTNARYEVSVLKQPIQVMSEPDGARLAIILGELHRSNRPTLINLLQLNSKFVTSKLSLDKEKQLILSSEWPYLDELAAAEAFASLMQQSEELHRTLSGLLVGG